MLYAVESLTAIAITVAGFAAVLTLLWTLLRAVRRLDKRLARVEGRVEALLVLNTDRE